MADRWPRYHLGDWRLLTRGKGMLPMGNYGLSAICISVTVILWINQ